MRGLLLIDDEARVTHASIAAGLGQRQFGEQENKGSQPSRPTLAPPGLVATPTTRPPAGATQGNRRPCLCGERAPAHRACMGRPAEPRPALPGTCPRRTWRDPGASPHAEATASAPNRPQYVEHAFSFRPSSCTPMVRSRPVALHVQFSSGSPGPKTPGGGVAARLVRTQPF